MIDILATTWVGFVILVIGTLLFTGLYQIYKTYKSAGLFAIVLATTLAYLIGHFVDIIL